MEPNTQNEAPQNQSGTDRQAGLPAHIKRPKGRGLLFVALLVIVMLGMYVGTFYKITVYGA